jgi:phosphoglycolate phosphatase
MTQGIIFDLDGTLLSTEADLTNAINTMLVQMDCRALSEEIVKSYLGNGIRKLVERSLPMDKLHQLEEAINIFHAVYAKCYMDLTIPYAGILEVLVTVQDKGYQLAVVSNKPQRYLDDLVTKHFPMIHFDCVYGESSTHKTKPNPQGIDLALNAMNCKAEDTFMVGDSVVDVETAQLCGLKCVPVAWGFQHESLLAEKAQREVVKKPLDLLQSFI